MKRHDIQRLTDFIRHYAVLNLGLAIIGAVLLLLFGNVPAAVGLLFSGIVFSALIYVFAITAASVQQTQRELRQLHERVLSTSLQHRVSELEAENAELKLIAETALNQRDAAG